eukprot:CAMPEP_0115296350 /NCGR_PEP_ID=MMETSP0270-20121206/67184_1 /TAXON_ID=71861 /ORGANISM="Scrippsiella trochoidea, Strain CCMP3099" /LENGTH=52 /DNA_ID=CAMNT_0002713967 /DNA_START=48 /DNA_END=206 /DNA_ORIENTATION=-
MMRALASLHPAALRHSLAPPIGTDNIGVAAVIVPRVEGGAKGGAVDRGMSAR